jgi:Alkylmercury lyase
MLERSAQEETLLREAFVELLAAPRPVSVARLAERLRTSSRDVEQVLTRLDEGGWVRRDSDGRVVGSRGLSIVPTRHELELPHGRRHTWCAYDTLGIFAALGVSGRICSRTPLDEAVVLEVSAGRVRATDSLVLFFPERQVGSVVEEWCPFANFFLDTETALGWSREHGIDGRVLTLEEAAEQGKADWRDCCNC